MKLLQVTDEASLPGGKSPYLRRVSRKLLEYGWETLFLSYRGGEADLPHAKVVHIGPSGEIRREIKAFKPDLVNTHCPVDDRLWEFISDFPVVRTVHNHDPYCPSGTKFNRRKSLPCGSRLGYLRCAGGYLINGCGSRKPWRMIKNILDMNRERRQLRDIPLIALSEYHREELIASGFKPENIFTNHVFGPDPGPISSVPPDTGGRPYILFPGRVVPYKGLDWLLDALRLSREKPLLVIAGDGYYIPSVKNRASQLGLEEHVVFKGWLDQPVLRWWIRHARAVAVPSVWHEPAGSIAAETMMIGTPLIISNVGGLKEFFLFGRGGLAVNPGDTAGLAGAIDLLASDQSLAGELGQEAHRIAVRYFDLSRHVRRLTDIFSLFMNKKHLWGLSSLTCRGDFT